MSDSEDDDLIYQQSMMMAARYGQTGAKHMTISEDKKKFDSADYYQKQAQVMKAAGMSVEEEQQIDDKDK